MFRSALIFGSILGATALVAGCATEADEADLAEAPELDVDGLETRQTVTYGGWTMSAAKPTLNGYDVRGSFTLSGSGVTGAGVCLLSVYLDPVTAARTTCTSASNCNNAPYWLPSGGYRYCGAINGSGTKYCMFRPGNEASYCAGSPATGLPIGPGTYNTAYQHWSYGAVYDDGDGAGAEYVSYSCLAGCSSSPASISPSLSVYIPHGG